MLRDYPEIRKIAYIVSSVIALALGAFQVAFSAAGAGQPDWLNVTWAVYAFLAVGLGVTASTNITSTINTNKGDSEDAQ